jgi:hypothetical protein
MTDQAFEPARNWLASSRTARACAKTGASSMPLKILRNARVRRFLVWAVLVGAVVGGVAVWGPPTREEPVSGTGWTDA